MGGFPDRYYKRSDEVPLYSEHYILDSWQIAEPRRYRTPKSSLHAGNIKPSAIVECGQCEVPMVDARVAQLSNYLPNQVS
ncbi:hypothetical protein J6590_020321 [Homalodisca vitripennis]|nr:hypothetical protein J6590_020321 [Homalodisca vitripennis]